MVTTILVRCNPEKFKENLRQLAKVLAGRSSRFTRVRHLFWAHLTKEVFRRVHASFAARSRGNVDDLGQFWNALKPRTVKRKSKTHRRGSRHGKVKVPPSKHPSWINRDTDELIESLAAGIITGYDYVPEKRQFVHKSGYVLEIGSRVKHAGDVEQLRNIFPPSRLFNVWVAEAVSVAIKKILPYLADLKD